MKTKTTAVGAWIWFAWKDVEDVPLEKAYVSFGEYVEADETDSFGVPDESIFYYFSWGEKEIQRMMENSTGIDFDIVKYELVYKDIPVESKHEERTEVFYTLGVEGVAWGGFDASQIYSISEGEAQSILELEDARKFAGDFESIKAARIITTRRTETTTVEEIE